MNSILIIIISIAIIVALCFLIVYGLFFVTNTHKIFPSDGIESVDSTNTFYNQCTRIHGSNSVAINDCMYDLQWGYDPILKTCKESHGDNSVKIQKCVTTLRGPTIPTQPKDTIQESKFSTGDTGKNAILVIDSNTYWSAVIMDGDLSTSSFSGSGDYSYKISCGKNNVISLNVQNQKDYGTIKIKLIQNGEILGESYSTMDYGIASIASKCQWSLWN